MWQRHVCTDNNVIATMIIGRGFAQLYAAALLMEMICTVIFNMHAYDNGFIELFVISAICHTQENLRASL